MLNLEYIIIDATANRYEADGGDMFPNSNWIMS